MGNKTDHLSTSKLGHALDFSLADPADRQILDEQVVSDILAQQTEALDSDTLRATSRMKIHASDKASWTQRVLSWIRRD